MTTSDRCPPSPTEVQAALLLLERLGVSAEDLTRGSAELPVSAGQGPASAASSGARRVVPTFAEYVPQVAATVSPGTLKAYGTYWNRVVERWGDRRLDEPTALEIRRFGEQLRGERVVRRNGRDGRGAVENFVAAMRCLYKQAVDDQLLSEQDNPARRVRKPRRLPSKRRALPDDGLREINAVAARTGNDPELDTLLLRLHTETACRRGGALALRPCDLDAEHCLIMLREKGGTHRWQPVSPTLMTHLQLHAAERGASGDQPLLRYRNGRPLTYRRYDHLWTRIGSQLPWVAIQEVSTHWIRHTILTWVERNFGYAVARAFAGHTGESGNPGATATYVTANIAELATAVAALTGEPHPLAP